MRLLHLQDRVQAVPVAHPDVLVADHAPRRPGRRRRSVLDLLWLLLGQFVVFQDALNGIKSAEADTLALSDAHSM